MLIISTFIPASSRKKSSCSSSFTVNLVEGRKEIFILEKSSFFTGLQYVIVFARETVTKIARQSL